ncbi:hypothetical protein H7I76_09040 [Mycolicibacterium vaccae]|nr:hypothetical protein [Mycolicibacterium vaccae]
MLEDGAIDSPTDSFSAAERRLPGTGETHCSSGKHVALPSALAALEHWIHAWVQTPADATVDLLTNPDDRKPAITDSINPAPPEYPAPRCRASAVEPPGPNFWRIPG